MEKSTWMVYSIIKNVYTFLNSNKDVNLFKKVHYAHFKKASKYFLENSKRIYNDIENSYYSYTDLIIHLLYLSMIGEKFSLYSIKEKTIKETLKLFTNKKLKEDLELIKIIYKEFNFKKGIKEYFNILEDGTNIAYVLTIRQKISPIFFIRNFEKVLTKLQEDVIFKSKEYKQFEKIAIKIKETIKGGSLDEQAEI